MLDKTRQTTPAAAAGGAGQDPHGPSGRIEKISWVEALTAGFYVAAMHGLMLRDQQSLANMSRTLGLAFSRYLMQHGLDAAPARTLRRKSQTVLDKHWSTIKAEMLTQATQSYLPIGELYDCLRALSKSIDDLIDVEKVEPQLRASLRAIATHGFESVVELPQGLATAPSEARSTSASTAQISSIIRVVASALSKKVQTILETKAPSLSPSPAITPAEVAKGLETQASVGNTGPNGDEDAEPQTGADAASESEPDTGTSPVRKEWQGLFDRHFQAVTNELLDNALGKSSWTPSKASASPLASTSKKTIALATSNDAARPAGRTPASMAPSTETSPNLRRLDETPVIKTPAAASAKTDRSSSGDKKKSTEATQTDAAAALAPAPSPDVLPEKANEAPAAAPTVVSKASGNKAPHVDPAAAPNQGHAILCLNARIDGDGRVPQIQRALFNWVIPRHESALPLAGLKGEAFTLTDKKIATSVVIEEAQGRSIWEMIVSEADNQDQRRIWNTAVTITTAPSGEGSECIFSLAQWIEGPEGRMAIAPAVPNFMKDLTSRSLITISTAENDLLTHAGGGALPHLADPFDAEIYAHELVSPTREHAVVMFGSHEAITIPASRDEANPLPVDLVDLSSKLRGLAVYMTAAPLAGQHLRKRFGGTAYAAGHDLHIFPPARIAHGSGQAFGSTQVFETNKHKDARERRLADAIRIIVGKMSVANAHAQLQEEGSGPGFLRRLAPARGPIASLTTADEGKPSEASAERESVDDDIPSSAASGIAIDRLNAKLNELSELNALYEDENKVLAERAEEAELQQVSLTHRIQILENRLEQAAGAPPPAALPTRWDEFLDFVDSELAGRIALTGRARRELRSPLYGNPELAAKCLVGVLPVRPDTRRVEH